MCTSVHVLGSMLQGRAANRHRTPCQVKPAIRVCRLCRAELAVGGVQGTDPGTDFRGAGLLALECLLFLAQRQPALFDKLRHKQEGARSQWEYPFAVGGVNLTFMLLGGSAKCLPVVLVKVIIGEDVRIAPCLLRSKGSGACIATGTFEAAARDCDR